MNGLRMAAGLSIAFALSAASFAAAPTAVTIGHLGDGRLREISGLAASHRHADRYWVHNDSGDGPFLYAIDAQGALVGTLQIDGVMAVDWEDIASYERDGKKYLLVGDIGDNFGLRPEYELIAIEEPELPADGSVLHVTAAWQIRFRYPQETPHDTEALAVDITTNTALLVPKFAEPLRAFRVPLQPTDDIVTATADAPFAAPTGVDPTHAPKFRVTAFDLSADGRHAALLGYRSAWLYTRHEGESWATTFARAPERIGVTPPLRQPEALGFSADGAAILVTGEGANEPLLRIDLPH